MFKLGIAVVFLVGCVPPADEASSTTPSSQTDSKCVTATSTALVGATSLYNLPGRGEHVVYEALLQAVSQLGLAIEAKDDTAHTVRTSRFAGLPIVHQCGLGKVTRERTYRWSLSVIGSTVSTTLGCLERITTSSKDLAYVKKEPTAPCSTTGGKIIVAKPDSEYAEGPGDVAEAILRLRDAQSNAASLR